MRPNVGGLVKIEIFALFPYDWSQFRLAAGAQIHAAF